MDRFSSLPLLSPRSKLQFVLTCIVVVVSSEVSLFPPSPFFSVFTREKSIWSYYGNPLSKIFQRLKCKVVMIIYKSFSWFNFDLTSSNFPPSCIRLQISLFAFSLIPAIFLPKGLCESCFPHLKHYSPDICMSH